MPATVTAFTQENLVSSRASDEADLFDPAFINAWGLAIRPAGAGGHWWITNTDTSRVTLYVGDSPSVPFGQDGLSVLGVPGAPGNDLVDIVIDPPTRDGVALPPPAPTPSTVLPGSNPTGQVFSGSLTDFLVDGTGLTGGVIDDAPARFITVSEDGTIAAWGEFGSSPAQRMDAFRVVIDNSATGAIYKGVTVSAESGSGNLLYAANFSGNAIEVYDATWQRVETSGFVLETAPGGRDLAEYAPFNVERVFDAARGEEVLIVPYAGIANAADGEEESTDGFIVKYTLAGEVIAMSGADGLFNAPWGVALAPAEWGDFDGALLVGNFGDGRILALDIDTLAFEGFLLDAAGAPIVIDGLWDLIFGNGASLGATDKLYFAAGPEEESHGLFGSLSIGPMGASVAPPVVFPVAGVLLADQGSSSVPGSGRVLLLQDGGVTTFFDGTNASGLAAPTESVFTLLQASDRAVFAGDGVTDSVYRLFDRNGDGDANDAGEATRWFSEANASGFTLPTPNGLAQGPDGAIYVVNAGVASRPSDSIYRTVDLNDDGDANDVGEASVWLNLQTVVASSSPFELVFVSEVAYLIDPSGGAPDSIFRIEDIDGSGTITAATEVSTFVTRETAFGAPIDFSLAADPQGLLVWEWLADGDAAHTLFRLTDLNGSGTIDAAEESVEIWNSALLPAGFDADVGFSVAADDAGRIALTSNGGAGNQKFVVLLEDLDGDGAFDGAGESIVLASNLETPDALYRPRAVEIYEGPVQRADTALSAGNHFSLFLQDGQALAAGENIVGQLGQGVTGFDIPAAIPIALPEGFAGEIVSVSAGLVHGSFLTADGALYTWGLGNFGRLGHGDQEDRTTATRVEALAGVHVAVATHGNGASYAITDTGALFAWGQNTNGQLGLGDTANRLVPTEVTALADHTVIDIATGISHTLALTADGQVYAWGGARQGQLGSPAALDAGGNPLIRVPSPVLVEGLPDNVVNVSASTLTSYAITADGRVFGWGEGKFGQLLQGTDNGDGTFTPAVASVLVPVELTQLPDNVIDVKGGARWAIALTADGDVYAWGPNDEGPTGGLDGDPAAESDASFYPRKIAALDAAFIVEIATGPNHVLARASDGRVFSFGANSDGRLGYPTEGLTTEPAVVPFPDDAAPFLLTAAPFDGASDVARNGEIVLTFTEAVFAGAGTITLADLDDPSRTITVDVADADSVAIEGATVTLVAPEILRAGTRYAIQIEAGAFVDASGQIFAGIDDDDTTTFNIRTGSAVIAGTIDKADLAVTAAAGGDPLPVSALGQVETAPLALGGRTWARVENEGPWGGLAGLALDGFDPRWGDALLVANFATVALDLSDAGRSDLAVTVVGARSGSVATAAGNDTIDWVFHSPGRSANETAHIDTGAGSDLVRATTVARSTLDQALLADNALPANGPQWKPGYDGRFSTLAVDLGAGDDRAEATDVRLVAHGGDGRDVLNGGVRDDDLFGDAGDDRLAGRAGDDVLSGGEGADVLVGQAGNDTLLGGAGNDFLDGGDGDDVLDGGTGNDVMRGSAGDDRLNGGVGLDSLLGGAGLDMFVLAHRQADRDWIDFVAGEDVLEVSAALFGGGLMAGALDPARLVVGANPAATQAGVGTFLLDTGTGRLRWDADGAGPGWAPIIATLTGAPSLSASDFVIV